MSADVVHAVVGCCGSPEARGEVAMQMRMILFLMFRRRSGSRCITDQRRNYFLNAGRLGWSPRGICGLQVVEDGCCVGVAEVCSLAQQIHQK